MTTGLWIKLPAMFFLSLALLAGCSSNKLPPSELQGALLSDDGSYRYRIGSNDVLNVFVWNNQDVSGEYPVSPDGNISMALTGNIAVAGKSTAEVEALLTEALAEYIRSPKVTVRLSQASGNTNEQVKLIGEATQPAALPYNKGMTLLDLMIAVGGLSRYADGNDAELLRVEKGEIVVYPLRIDDLMNDADMTANVDLLPGDIIRIPEAWF